MVIKSIFFELTFSFKSKIQFYCDFSVSHFRVFGVLSCFDLKLSLGLKLCTVLPFSLKFGVVYQGNY